MALLGVLLVVSAFVATHGLNNGQAITPQMGYNPWNHYNCHITDQILRDEARALVSLGLAKKGYTYVNIDDCWEVSRDADTHVIVPDPQGFPNGMRALADYIHSLGLKFGIYSSAGNLTCKGRPGSVGFEDIDAKTYAEWTVDYVKYDECHPPSKPSPQERYIKMRDALNATGRPMLYSLSCASDLAGFWAPPVANSWRTTFDERDTWFETLVNMDINNIFAAQASPGAWNDADMMEIGNGGLTYEEERTHMSIWSLMKSPLLIGCDLLTVNATSLALHMNDEVIAVNQDALGKQGERVWSSLWGEPLRSHSHHAHIDKIAARINARTVPAGNVEVWAGAQQNGDVVVILFNRGMSKPTTITAKWEYWGWDKTITAKARDLWTHSDIGSFTGQFVAKDLAPHSIQMIRLSKA